MPLLHGIWGLLKEQLQSAMNAVENKNGENRVTVSTGISALYTSFRLFLIQHVTESHACWRFLWLTIFKSVPPHEAAQFSSR